MNEGETICCKRRWYLQDAGPAGERDAVERNARDVGAGARERACQHQLAFPILALSRGTRGSRSSLHRSTPIQERQNK